MEFGLTPVGAELETGAEMLTGDVDTDADADTSDADSDLDEDIHDNSLSGSYVRYTKDAFHKYIISGNFSACLFACRMSLV